MRDELNFRDLGGFPTIDGKIVKSGVFYRSCKLSCWKSDELEILNSMKIKTILDLRTDYESYDDPDPSIQNIQIYRVSGMRELDGVGVDFSSVGIRKMNLKNSELAQHMEELYVNMMFNNQAFKFMWMIINDVDSYPLLFHCASGKDRTGALAALIYLALGVPKEYLILDYLTSNIAYKDKICKEFKCSSLDLESDFDNCFTIMMECGVNIDLGYKMINKVFNNYRNVFDFFKIEYGIEKAALLEFRKKYTV